jgi:hypothetical protein
MRGLASSSFLLYDFLGMQSLRCQWCSIKNSTESMQPESAGRSFGENFTAARSAHQLEMDRESVVKLTRAMKNRLNGIRNKK